MAEAAREPLKVRFTEQQIALLEKLREQHPPGTALAAVALALFRDYVAAPAAPGKAKP